jgi:hypothetical protein
MLSLTHSDLGFHPSTQPTIGTIALKPFCRNSFAKDPAWPGLEQSPGSSQWCANSGGHSLGRECKTPGAD